MDEELQLLKKKAQDLEDEGSIMQKVSRRVKKKKLKFNRKQMLMIAGGCAALCCCLTIIIVYFLGRIVCGGWLWNDCVFNND